MRVADMDGVPMLAFTRTPSDALALGVKRAFDVVISAAVLVVLSPLFAAIALAIRIDSPGPIFFKQRRIGQSGRVFEVLKFRSMFRDAEGRLEALRAHNEMSGPVFKMANDPRVTKVGRLLRRTSLDEFPQFWNVLKGEMSIVGPRPPIPSEVRQYKRWQRRRLSMKPGITCIWQISGRNDIDFERWMELDLQYIDEWSLWGDIEIFFKTIPAVLSSRGTAKTTMSRTSSSSVRPSCATVHELGRSHLLVIIQRPQSPVRRDPSNFFHRLFDREERVGLVLERPTYRPF